MKEEQPINTMTASSNQNDFLEKCAFVRSCKRLSPDIANTAANQEVLYVLAMFELWVLKEMEWAITPAKPDSIIANERKYKVFFIL
jgi:hypothetical protein